MCYRKIEAEAAREIFFGVVSVVEIVCLHVIRRDPIRFLGNVEAIE